MRSHENVREQVQRGVTVATKTGDIGASTARTKATSLREVGAFLQNFDEALDLSRVRRTIGVEHDDDVSGRDLESASQRVALAPPSLREDVDLGHDPTGRVNGVVARMAVYEDHLVHQRQLRQHQLEVASFVLGWNDDRHRRLTGPLRYAPLHWPPSPPWEPIFPSPQAGIPTQEPEFNLPQGLHGRTQREEEF